MTVDTWKKLWWRYRFNSDVTVDIENETCSWKGQTYEDLLKVAALLSEHVLSKAARIMKIDKGNGTFRYVYSANDLYKSILQDKLPYLEGLLNKADPRGMFHAFRSNKNAVTNARAHIGFGYSAKFDMKSFFDHVKPGMVNDKIPHLIDLTFIDGAPRQGLPTSPLIASLAMQPIAYGVDDALKKIIKGKYAITCYADDLTISFHHRMQYEDIKELVYKHIKAADLQINYKKTALKFGHKKGMRRIICGIAVGKTNIYRTRATKHAIRKALYNSENSKALGLMEWARCKVPRSIR